MNGRIIRDEAEYRATLQRLAEIKPKSDALEDEYGDVRAVRRRLAAAGFDANALDDEFDDVRRHDFLKDAAQEYLMRRLESGGIEAQKTLDEALVNSPLWEIHLEQKDEAVHVWICRWAGVSRWTLLSDELRARAAARWLLAQRAQEQYSRALNEKGEVVLCQYCEHRCYYGETERVKPRGSSRYLRLCPKCAKAAKLKKALARERARSRPSRY